MSKSNKMILTLSITAFIIVSIIVGVVMVFAADDAIVRNVIATYNVIDADCSVSVSCKFGDLNSNTFGNAQYLTADATEKGDKTLDFEKDKNKQTKTLMSTSDFKLNKNNNCIVYEFNFVNKGEKSFNASLIVEDVIEENFVIEYSKDGISWKDYAVRINVPVSSADCGYFVRISLVKADDTYECSASFNWTVCGEF